MIGLRTLLDDEQLRTDERLLRTDPVALIADTTGWALHRGALRQGVVADLSITTQRLLFRRPTADHPFLAWMKTVPRLRPRSIAGSFQSELTNVANLWKWSPEFVAQPAVTFKHRNPVALAVDWTPTFSFLLLRGNYPKYEIASLDEIRRHFDDLEAARSTSAAPA